MRSIIFPTHTILAQKSKTSLSLRRSSSSWSQHGSSSSNASVEMRRPSVTSDGNKSSSQQEQSSFHGSPVDTLSSSSSSSSNQNDNDAAVDDWGFFVDLTGQDDQPSQQRQFLNGYDSGLRGSSRTLETIPDSGF